MVKGPKLDSTQIALIILSLVILGIAIKVFFLTPSTNETQNQYTTSTPSTPAVVVENPEIGDDETILWGIAPARNICTWGEYNPFFINQIPISKIIDDIDIFWDWMKSYNLFTKDKLWDNGGIFYGGVGSSTDNTDYWEPYMDNDKYGYFDGNNKFSVAEQEVCIKSTDGTNAYQECQTHAIYDLPANHVDSHNKRITEKYMPMIWSHDSYDILLEYLDTEYGRYTKYVLGWNEPDMTGSILQASATGAFYPSDSTSAGFWTQDYQDGDSSKFPVYGYYGPDLDEMPDTYESIANDSNFEVLAQYLYKEIQGIKSLGNSTIKIATPVMANGPLISKDYKCVGIKPLDKEYRDDVQFIDADDYKGVLTKKLSSIGIQQPKGAHYDYQATKPGDDTLADWCGLDTSDSLTNGFPIVKFEKSNTPPKFLNGKDIAKIDPTIDKTPQYNCYNQCGTEEDPRQSCRCNGWLKLIQLADEEKNEGKYWNNVDIINIHLYHYYAHVIKLRLLQAIKHFKENMPWYDNPESIKEIWLTETACIYPSKTTNSNVNDLTTTDADGIDENVTFIQELFWLDTSWEAIGTDVDNIVDDLCEEIGIKSNTVLPGIRTTDKFFTGLDDNSLDRTWKQWGLGGATFFSALIPGWYEDGFVTNPETATTTYVDSRLFSYNEVTGTIETNDIWDALTGKTTGNYPNTE